MADAKETSTTAATYSQSDRGSGGGGGRRGGGKLRRERKTPATPYDRPFRGRWISKLVGPAKRIFSGLPSLFSYNLVDEVHTQTEHEDGVTEENCSLDPVIPDSTRGFASSEDKGKLRLVISDEDGREKVQGYSSGGVPDIEQLIKRKTFSREEIDRLMKVLHTRVVDVEQDRNTPVMKGNEVERAETCSTIFKTSLDDEEDLNKLQLTTSTSPQSAREDGIGASPVDIAKAYMSWRASEMGFTSTRSVQKSEKLGLTGDYISNSVMPSPLRKAPICWPGAITHNQLDYATPSSWNNRSGLHKFSRTPYSRTIYSKSKSRLNPLRGDNERFPSISPAPFQPTATPAYEKFMNNVAESGYGMGGPIRRMQNRSTLGTPTRDSPLFSTARRSPLVRGSSPVPLPKKTIELGNTSNTNIDLASSKAENPEARVHIVHPHSNRLAWKILEQLDQPVTLKEQSKELTLALSQHDISVPKYSSPSMAKVGVGEHNNLDGVDLCGRTNRESNVLYQGGSNKNGAKNDIFGSMVSMHKPSSVSEVDNVRSSEQGIYNNAPKASLHFGEPSRGSETINNITPRSESRISQRKPILPSIAVEKSSFTTSFSSITSSSFTFPVSTSSSSFTEPPTPSIIPSISTITPPQPKGSVPTSNSRNKITIAPPVVAFSSITTFKQNDVSALKLKFQSEKPRLSFAVPGDDTSAPNDAAIPKFRFGSGESRLNFRTVASDALCC